MEVDPGAKTWMPVAQLENLASWSSTIETSRGCTEDALMRHRWKDSRHWLAEAATVGRFSAGLGSMAASLPAEERAVGGTEPTEFLFAARPVLQLGGSW